MKVIFSKYAKQELDDATQHTVYLNMELRPPGNAEISIGIKSVCKSKGKGANRLCSIKCEVVL
ncbi:MAG: hypothetical protein C4549_01130 [Deltaproteobacteria bacterium]|jgi:hypothetical protein|nr:MAG: hypothetical protein C4549_01130 [Deltaproteobacteria bacterium]